VIYIGPPNTVKIVKSERLQWAGHVTWMGDKKCNRILVGKHHGKHALEN
jgi:hypothetical protein